MVLVFLVFCFGLSHCCLGLIRLGLFGLGLFGPGLFGVGLFGLGLFGLCLFGLGLSWSFSVWSRSVSYWSVSTVWFLWCRSFPPPHHHLPQHPQARSLIATTKRLH